MLNLSPYRRCLIALLLCGVVAGFAQPARLRVERLGVEQGIPLSHIVEVMQDSRGFVWIGGYAGLFRFDGNKTQHFTSEPGDSLSIGDNRVTTIVESADGRGLWIGTQHNLNYFDRKTETFKRYFEPNSGDPVTGRKYIMGLCELSSGLLVLLQARELGIFDPATGNYQMLEQRKRGALFLRLCKGRDGSIWVGAQNGLFKINFAANTLEPAPLEGMAARLPVHAIVEGQADTLWLGSLNNIIHYDVRSGRAEPHLMSSDTNAYFNALLLARDGTLWCGAANGLFRYGPERRNIEHFEHERKETYSLSNNGVNALFEDRSGIIWAGTAAGVNVIKPFTAFFNRIPNDYQFENDVPSRMRAFFEMAPGHLLLWEKEGLMVLDWEKGVQTPFPHKPVQEEQIKAWNTGVYCFFKDKQGRIWMGTHGGVFVFDPATENFSHYKRDAPDPRHSLSSNIIRDINQDHTGAIWIATWGGGLNRLDEKTGGILRFLNDPVHEDTYENAGRRIFVDRRGTVWAGTRGGLQRYDPVKKAFKRYYRNPDDPKSIGENTAFDIYEDENGFLWIGTYGGGLNRFDTRKETFKRFTIKDGLPDNNVFSVLPDDKGHLWLSTYGGIVKFHLKTEKILRTLNYRDGLLNQQLDAFGHYKMPSTGELVFEGKQGLDIFHPDDVKPDTIRPIIRITDFQLFNKSVSICLSGKCKKREGYYLEQAISETEKLVLPYSQRGVMTFEFAALHFGNPGKNQYAYWLKGFDTDWQHIGNRNNVTFTKLRPGHYTLRVKASNADGAWNEEGASIEIIITPPWWLTWWAYCLYILAAAGTIYAFFRFQRRRWREQAELAEKEREAERLKELDAFRKQVYDNVTHELRTPLTVIIGLAEKLLAEGDGHGRDAAHCVSTTPTDMELIRRNGYRLLQIVNQILDLSKLEAGMLPVNMVQDDSARLRKTWASRVWRVRYCRP